MKPGKNELVYRIPAALFGLADAFGILFFLSTVSWWKIAGPLLMIYIALAPTRFVRANRWLLVILVGGYLPTYWHRVQSLFPIDELAIPDVVVLAVEAVIVLLFMGFLCRQGGKELEPSNSQSR